MTENRYVKLSERGLITVGGPDRKEFLQGLISNDIEQVSPERAIWAALLTAQGKYLHDFFIVEIDDVFYLDCEAERLMDLGQRLSRFKLRAEVDLGIADGFGVWACYGPEALARADLESDPGIARSLAEGTVYCDPRISDIGARAALSAKSAGAYWQKLGIEPGSAADYDRLRISLGLPDGSRDMVVEKAILLENNFDPLHGVDWNKGCYVGQELTARTKYRGLIKKRLIPVEISGDTPEIGTQVTADGRDAGEVRSLAGGLALALIRRDKLDLSVEQGVPLVAGNATLTPRLPEWQSI